MKDIRKKHIKAILAFALTLAVTVAFMPISGGVVYAASFDTSGSVANLKLVAKDAHAITLKWDEYTGATGYKVYKATSKSGKYSKLKSTSDTTYVRTGLTTDKTCYYKVKAYYKSSSGKYSYSQYSSVVAATPEAFATDKAVSQLQAVSDNDVTITLSWDSIKWSTGYEVYKSTSKDGKFDLIKTLSETSWQRTGLTTNKTCYYKVRAYQKDTKGNISYSKFSSIVAGTPVGFDTDKAAARLKVATVTYNTVSFQWDEFPLAEGYQVYKASSKDGSYSKIKTTSSISWTRKNLTTNKSCYYKVRAYGKRSNGDTVYSKYSSVVTGTPKLGKPELTASSSTSGVSLSWEKISGASGYVIYRATSKDGSYSSLNSVDGTSYKNTDLTKDKAYYYKVRAYRTVDGSKLYGSYSCAQLGMKTSVATVSGLTASSTDSSIKLKWSKVDQAEGYEIYRASDSADSYSKVGTSDSTSFYDKNVANGVTYYYKVRAYKLINGSKIKGSFSKKGFSREAVVKTAVGWLGCKESNKSNKPIIDLYNKNMGTNFSYTTPWCAMFVSAVAIKSGTTSIIVRGSDCPSVINTYKNSKNKNYSYGAGCNYKPKPGDVIFFDLNKNGVTDHTGMVATVSGSTIKTIEGNYSDAVGYRTFSVGYGYVQGYGLPNYDNANGIVYTGKSNTSVGCGELSAEGIGTAPEGYDALGSEYDFVEQKVENNVSSKGKSEYKKVKYMVKKARQNAEAEKADCSTSQYYAAFIYKLCMNENISASIMAAENENGDVKAWVEANLDGKWYRIDASKKSNQIKAFTPEATDVQ